MNALRILLVEDDPMAALDVEVLLHELGYELMACVDNGEAALEKIHTEMPDLLIMDIQLKGALSGLDVAKEIAPLHIPVIFTTFFKDKATYEDAMRTNAHGYLVKPFNKLSLQNMIEMTVKNLFSANTLDEKDAGSIINYLLHDRFLIKINGILQKVMFSDILFVKGEGNYTTLNTKEKRFIVKISLKKMMEKLPPAHFAPIHKSYIAQVEKVESVDPAFNQVTVGGESLPLGRHFRNGFLDRFQILR